MSRSDLGSINASQNFSIPFNWHKEIDTHEMKEYFDNIRKSQIILKSITVEKEESEMVKEIYSHRKKIVRYLQVVSASYSFKNETYFKAVQIFDTYMHKIIIKFLAHLKCEAEEIRLKFVDFVNNLFVYAVLCLNIACKLEEINCNYLSFFNDNLLNKRCNFTIIELSNRETEILKFLNFKISMPTPFEFNSVFIQITIHEIFSHDETFSSHETPASLIVHLLNLNDNILKTYSEYFESIFNSSLTSGLICFKSSLISLSKILKVDLTPVLEKFNKIILSYINNMEYLNKIDVEACKVYSRFASNKQTLGLNNNEEDYKEN